jgi:hypothetical protein
MHGTLYLELLGANPYQRFTIAIDHCFKHNLWFRSNIRTGRHTNFIQTDDYKIIHTGENVVFEVADIRVFLHYVLANETFIGDLDREE